MSCIVLPAILSKYIYEIMYNVMIRLYFRFLYILTAVDNLILGKSTVKGLF